MKLSTGKVAFPIEFDNGDKAVIYFNPNDRGIQERIKHFEKSVENRIDAIDTEKYKKKFGDKSNIEIDISDPEKLFEMSAEELQFVQDRLDAVIELESEHNTAVKEELDVVFGSKISDVVFSYCQPLDTVIVEDENGNQTREIYIIHFLRWFMVEMKKHGMENKSAMDKHIAKYRK